MPLMPPLHRPRGQRTRREARVEHDARRGSARSRGYDAQWDRDSLAYRREKPFCEYCEVGAFGPARATAATCVDHLYPHRGDREVFRDRAGWVSSCDACHAGPKQAAERQGLPALHRLADLLGRPRRG